MPVARAIAESHTVRLLWGKIL